MDTHSYLFRPPGRRSVRVREGLGDRHGGRGSTRAPIGRALALYGRACVSRDVRRGVRRAGFWQPERAIGCPCRKMRRTAGRWSRRGAVLSAWTSWLVHRWLRSSWAGLPGAAGFSRRLAPTETEHVRAVSPPPGHCASSRGEPRRTAVGRQCFAFDGGGCAVVRGAECDTCGPSQRTAVAVNECDGA